MKKSISPANSPYQIDLSGIDTANWANNKQIFEITGAVQVFLPPAASLVGNSVEIFFVNMDDTSELALATVGQDTAAMVAPDTQAHRPQFRTFSLQAGENVYMGGAGGCLRACAVGQTLWKLT